MLQTAVERAMLTNAHPERSTRGDFLLGAMANVIATSCVLPSSAFVAAGTVPENAISGPMTTVTVDAAFAPRNTWWTIYTSWNPGIQRYPGCFLAPIVQNAEAGDETSIAHLIENGVYADIQELLRMQSNSGAVFSSSVPMHTLPTTAVDRARIATRNVRPG